MSATQVKMISPSSNGEKKKTGQKQATLQTECDCNPFLLSVTHLFLDCILLRRQRLLCG